MHREEVVIVAEVVVVLEKGFNPVVYHNAATGKLCHSAYFCRKSKDDSASAASYSGPYQSATCTVVQYDTKGRVNAEIEEEVEVQKGVRVEIKLEVVIGLSTDQRI